MAAVHVLRTLRGGAAALVLGGALVAAPAAAVLDRSAPDRSQPPHLVLAQAVSAAVSPYQELAPDLFEATGTALWDGKRTLQGVWIAHPLATAARRVRIYNSATGAAVDGALFKRDPALSGPAVLVSSEAAQFLGMTPGEEVGLRIVALTPSQRPQAAGTDAPPVAAVAEPAPSQPAAATAGLPGGGETPPPASTAGTALPAPMAATPLASAARPDGAAGAVTAAPLADRQPGAAIRLPEPQADAAPAALETVAEDGRGAMRIPAPRPQQEPAASTVPSDRARGRALRSAPPSTQPQPAITTLPEPAAEAPAPVPARPLFQAAPESPADGALAAPTVGGVSLAAAAAIPAQAQPAVPAPQVSAPLVPAPSAATVIASAPVPDAATAPAGADRLSRPFVQAGIFGNAENAARLIGRLEAANLPAQVKPITLNGRAATRVLAGPFAGAGQRDEALRTIRGMGLKDAAPVAR